MKNENYESPVLSLLSIETEQGFAASPDKVYGGIDAPDMDYGGDF